MLYLGQESKEPSRQLKCLMSDNQVGRIIGKGGANIKQLREGTGALISTPPAEASGERAVTLAGSSVAVVSAFSHMISLIATMPVDQPRAY